MGRNLFSWALNGMSRLGYGLEATAESAWSVERTIQADWSVIVRCLDLLDVGYSSQPEDLGWVG